ncbi:MAG: hypothetical protein M1834_009249 [Cirrosporium novae-zelandiae]|nr:MAG: hypothetical protein M1834_009249 [Cirrosporium novae-zelandiae]
MASPSPVVRSKSLRVDTTTANGEENGKTSKLNFLRRLLKSKDALIKRTSRSTQPNPTSTPGTPITPITPAAKSNPSKTEQASVSSSAKAKSKPNDTKSKSTSKKARRSSVTPPSQPGSEPLTQHDLQMLFSGAPQFLVERGEENHLFPQVWFPYDPDNETSDLSDRLHLQHESFAASTLHAHLPVHKRLKKQEESEQDEKDLQKRARFDSGVYELPNMLSMQGAEPGTVGFRYFMELPVADALKPPETGRGGGPHPGDSVVERQKLINEGPKAWKKIGIRDIKLDQIAQRLHELTCLHDKFLAKGPQSTILDMETSESLYRSLFTTFLIPPLKLPPREAGDPYSLKVQIESLVKTLSAKGSWINFSHVEWRIRLGQLLWEDSTASLHNDTHKKLAVQPRVERKWLLLQILLSMELLVRLDAIIKIAFVEGAPELDVSAEEIEIFNRLRSRKVDWDLILARVFFDEVQVELYKRDSSSASSQVGIKPTPPPNNRLLSALKRPDLNHDQTLEGDADCIILPRHPKLQLEGLLHFARFLSWPNHDQLSAQMHEKLGPSSVPPSPADSIYATPLQTPQSTRSGYFDFSSYAQVRPGNVSRPSYSQKLKSTFSGNEAGGWLSRSWLVGLVLPGEATSHFLISTLLENDADALLRLGDCASLYGGFIYDGRSWWSKACVAGRVIACLPESKECLGWISSPVVPQDPSAVTIPETWAEIDVQSPPKRDRPRLKDIFSISSESSITGISAGFILPDNFTLPVDPRPIPSVAISFDSLTLTKENTSHPASPGANDVNPTVYKASTTFTITSNNSPKTITFDLLYDIYFIAAFPCRPPPGHAAHATSIDSCRGPHMDPIHPEREHLPAHLLHKSYSYTYKSLSELYGAVPPVKNRNNKEIWVIDARGSKAAEAFARSWCAQVAYHAVIARARKTCLSCSIREARALDVAIIIRV